MFYGPDSLAIYRRSATFVDKILKGRKPAELPVEQPTKFEFIINLKSAKQIGVTIPPDRTRRGRIRSLNNFGFAICGAAFGLSDVGRHDLMA